MKFSRNLIVALVAGTLLAGVMVVSAVNVTPANSSWFNLPTTDSNVTNGATHYHTLKVNPYWAKSYEKTVVIENHIFYR